MALLTAEGSSAFPSPLAPKFLTLNSPEEPGGVWAESCAFGNAAANKVRPIILRIRIDLVPRYRVSLIVPSSGLSARFRSTTVDMRELQNLASNVNWIL